MKKYRIIYYSPHPTHDIVSTVGYSVHQRETIQAFRNLGHEVLPVIMGGTDPDVVNASTNIIQKRASSVSKIKRILPLFIWNAVKDILLLIHDKKAAIKLENAINEFRPDVIYERGEYLQDSGVKIADRYKIKHVLEVNSPVVEEMAAFEGPDILRALGHRKEKKKLKYTSQIITVSSALKNYLQDFYGCHKDIYVAPNAINPNLDVPTADKLEEIKSKYPSGTRIIGFVGSILPYHGVDKLISAFSEIARLRNNIHLMIVGDGSIRQSLEKEALRILPAGTYTFVGSVPHKMVMNYISVFDVAVMPSSNWYGSPVKIFEYGWLAKPIIAPDKIPLRDVMEHKTHGYLVSDDVGKIKSALLDVLDNPQKSKEMGERFRNKILNNHTWYAQTEKIVSAFSL